MKKVVFIISGIFLMSALLSIGCTPKASNPSAKQPVTGTLTGVNTPSQQGPDTVTVNTPQGNVAVQVTPDTYVAFNGQFCKLEDLEAKVAANSSYNCTIVYDDMQGALAVYVTGP